MKKTFFKCVLIISVAVQLPMMRFSSARLNVILLLQQVV